MGATAVESSYWPSPSRSHAYVIESPGSGSLEPDPLNSTVNGAAPVVGLAVATAVGGLFAGVKLTRLIVPPSKSG